MNIFLRFLPMALSFYAGAAFILLAAPLFKIEIRFKK